MVKKRFYLSQCENCGASFNETYEMTYGNYDARDSEDIQCCNTPCPIYRKTEPQPNYCYLEIEDGER